jgi:hypothetical protein
MLAEQQALAEQAASQLRVRDTQQATPERRYERD